MWREILLGDKEIQIRYVTTKDGRELKRKLVFDRARLKAIRVPKETTNFDKVGSAAGFGVKVLLDDNETEPVSASEDGPRLCYDIGAGPPVCW